MNLTYRPLLLFLLLLVGASGCKVKSNTNMLILDMVHNNPGEDAYQTTYNDPQNVKDAGFNGKVYFLFESPMLATTWETVDADILPKGTPDREWVDAKIEKIKSEHEKCREAGLSIWAQSDLVLFPKRLIEKFGIEDDFGDPNNPLVEKLLRAQVNEMFDQFPELDGLVIRIGETYLHDAPYHKGKIDNKRSAEKTIIPLLNILRDEICVKRDKQLLFRTWLAFDKKVEPYMVVNDAIEPHKNLTIAVKFCDGDFHRTTNFSKVIGEGRHRQVIEVQSAREYEGKGAYPNYIAHGVIEGFEEYDYMPEEELNGIREFYLKKPELFAGIWTWSRGGGWGGPYIQNELWCDINTWVMAQWAQDPAVEEELIFNRYAKEKLGLKGDDVSKLRELCLLSAEAVVRGRNTVEGDMNVWWTRDAGIGKPVFKTENYDRILKQKDEAVEKWQQIIKLAESIEWADEQTREHAIGSSYYGLYLYEIYRSAVNIAVGEQTDNKEMIKHWIGQYDKSWEKYNKLPEQFEGMSSLYAKDYTRHIKSPMDVEVERLRKTLK